MQVSATLHVLFIPLKPVHPYMVPSSSASIQCNPSPLWTTVSLFWPWRFFLKDAGLLLITTDSSALADQTPHFFELFKSLLGLLALAFYWLALILLLNPFLLFYILPWGSWPPCNVAACIFLLWQLHGFFWLHLLSPSIQFSFTCLALFCPVIGPSSFFIH